MVSTDTQALTKVDLIRETQLQHGGRIDELHRKLDQLIGLASAPPKPSGLVAILSALSQLLQQGSGGLTKWLTGILVGLYVLKGGDLKTAIGFLIGP
jgi:hypothetical protein